MYGKQAFTLFNKSLFSFERCVILYGKQAPYGIIRIYHVFERCVILYGKQAMAQEINDLA